MTGCPAGEWSVVGETESSTGAIISNLFSIPIPSGATGWEIILVAKGYSSNANIAAVTFQAFDPDDVPKTSQLSINLLTATLGALYFPGSTFGAGASRFEMGVLVHPNDHGPSDVEASGEIVWTGDCDATELCGYGTQLKPGVVAGEIITGAVVDIVLAAVGMPWLAVVFDALVGLTFNTGATCNGLPPPVPAAFEGASVGTYPVTPAPADILQFFEAIAWPVFCECKPAEGVDPAPTDPPPVDTAPPPVTIPPPPVVLPPPPLADCDGSDICTVLNVILALEQKINARLTDIINAIKALQTTPVPTGYKRGRLYSGLSGTGELPASGTLVGVAVSLTGVPLTISRDTADPINQYDVGIIALGTAEGWLTSTRIRHNPHLFMPIAGGIHKIGYSFPSPVEGAIMLLEPA